MGAKEHQGDIPPCGVAGTEGCSFEAFSSGAKIPATDLGRFLIELS